MQHPDSTFTGTSKLHAGSYGPDIATDYACDFIDQHRDQPFLLYYPMVLTHCPFEPTPKSTDWDSDSNGSRTYKGRPQYFGDMVTYMDHCVGRILKRLEDAGVAENTLVMFTGDNGTDKPIVSQLGNRMVAGAKGKTTDGGTRVPLIVRWPGQTVAGHVSDSLVDFSDFLPTMLAAAQVQLPVTMQVDGISFLPELTGQDGPRRRWIYLWYSRNGGVSGTEFCRDQRYKLYRDGRFFDITNDVLELTPVPVDALTDRQRAVRDELQKGLDRFADVRPEKFANWEKLDKKALQGQ